MGGHSGGGDWGVTGAVGETTKPRIVRGVTFKGARVATAVPGQEERHTVDGVTLQVYRGGQGATLLVLHDCEVMTAWQPYHAALATRFTVLAPSHPGFGASERPEGIESIDDLAYLYLDFIAALGPQHVDVLGLGMGGWIAAEMAVRCSHALGHLILADAVGIKVSGRTEVDIVETFILSREQLLAVGWHDAALGAERMKLPGGPGLADEELLTLIRNREAAARLTWKPFMHNPALRRWLHRITVPTLVIWGESDRIVRPDYGRAFQQAIPGAQFRLIPAAGHYPYLEQPEAFVASVTAFLS
jgi:pimeloyl-ACP methyl ester carboxylesterase